MASNRKKRQWYLRPSEVMKEIGFKRFAVSHVSMSGRTVLEGRSLCQLVWMTAISLAGRRKVSSTSKQNYRSTSSCVI